MSRSARSVVIGSYVVTGVLGSGSFATVYKAHHRSTGKVVAIKAISTRKLDRKAQANLESEIAILQRVRHVNIVRLFEIQKSDKYIYLVLEYCSGGDLSRLIHKRGPLSEARSRGLMRQLASGIEFLWSNHLIHRDLKPQNLLLTDDTDDAVLKIADFGFARHLSVASLAETLCGSPLYMAPEILRFQRYDAKADLWSVGAILFEMLTKRPPFTGANHIELLANIEKHEARLPKGITLSAECETLLKLLLRRNPLMRVSFQEFFASPFLQMEPVGVGGGDPSLPATPATAGEGGHEAGAGAGAGTAHQPPPPHPTSSAAGLAPPVAPPSQPSDASVPSAAGAPPPPLPPTPTPVPSLGQPARQRRVSSTDRHQALASPNRPPTGLSVFGLESAVSFGGRSGNGGDGGAGSGTAGDDMVATGDGQRVGGGSTAGPPHLQPVSGGGLSGGGRTAPSSPSSSPSARFRPTAVQSPGSPAVPVLLPPPPGSPGFNMRRSASDTSLHSRGHPSPSPPPAIGSHDRRQSAPVLQLGVNPTTGGSQQGATPSSSPGTGTGTGGQRLARRHTLLSLEPFDDQVLQSSATGGLSVAGAAGTTGTGTAGRGAAAATSATASPSNSSEGFVVVRADGTDRPGPSSPHSSLLAYLSNVVPRCHRLGRSASVVAELGRQAVGVAASPIGAATDPSPSVPALRHLPCLTGGTSPPPASSPGVVFSATVAALDAYQEQVACRAYAHGLALYLKASRLFEAACGATTEALERVAATRLPYHSSQLTKAVEELGEVARWLRRCFRHCLRNAGACAPHVPPASPPACAEQLLFERAIQLGKVAAVKELMRSTSGPGYLPECCALYGEAITMLQLLLAGGDDSRDLPPEDAKSVTFFCRTFAQRLAGIQAVVLSPGRAGAAAGCGFEPHPEAAAAAVTAAVTAPAVVSEKGGSSPGVVGGVAGSSAATLGDGMTDSTGSLPFARRDAHTEFNPFSS